MLFLLNVPLHEDMKVCVCSLHLRMGICSCIWLFSVIVQICASFSHSECLYSVSGPVVWEAAEGSSHGAAGFSTDRGPEESSSALPLGSDPASTCSAHPHVRSVIWQAGRSEWKHEGNYSHDLQCTYIHSFPKESGFLPVSHSTLIN